MSTTLSTIAEAKLKIRWEEPYVSQALNMVVGALNAGILMGFDVHPGGGLSVDLEVNTETGLSAMFVRNSTDGLSVLYRDTATVALDLSAHASTTIYIGVAVTYVTGSSTTGTIKAYTQSEYDAGLGDVELITMVEVPASGNIADDEIYPVYSDMAWREPHESNFAPMRTMSLEPIGIYLPQERGPKDAAGNVQSDYVATSGSHTGKAWTFTYNAAPSNKSMYLGTVPVDAEEYLHLHWRMLIASSGVADTGGWYLDWLDEDYASLGTEYIGLPVSADEGWTEYKDAVIAPSDAKWVKVSFAVENMSAGVVKMERPRVAYRDDNSRTFRDDIGMRNFSGVTLNGEGFAGQGIMWYDDASSVLSISAIEGSGTSHMALNGGTGGGNLTLTFVGQMSANVGDVDFALATGEFVISQGKLQVTEQIEVGGAYSGGSGVTITTTGNLSMNGDLVVDGTISAAGGFVAIELASPYERKLRRHMTGDETVDGVVWQPATTPAWTPASATHSVSGFSVPSFVGWDHLLMDGLGSGNMWRFLVPPGATVTDIRLGVGEGDATDNVTWTCRIYETDNDNTDEGMEYIGSFADVTSSGILGGQVYKEMTMAADGGWSNFVCDNGELWVEIHVAKTGGTPPGSAWLLYALSVEYEFTSIENAGR